MKRRMLVILGLILLVSLWVFSSNLSFATEEAAQGDTVFISGTVIDYHNEPVKEARVRILVNGQPQKIMVEHEEAEETETSSQGTLLLISRPEICSPAGSVQGSQGSGLYGLTGTALTLAFRFPARHFS